MTGNNFHDQQLEFSVMFRVCPRLEFHEMCLQVFDAKPDPYSHLSESDRCEMVVRFWPHEHHAEHPFVQTVISLMTDLMFAFHMTRPMSTNFK